jgi:PAS domain S-box-containing protein
LVRGIPLRNSDSRIVKWLGTSTDIHDQKLAERRLRHTKERFRLLVEGVKDCAIFMLDPEGHVASWNAGAERIKGYPAREIMGKHFSVFFTPEDLAADKPNQELKEAAAKGSADEEGWRVRKDGSRFWANVGITALRDEAGQLRGFAKVTRDITERKQADEKLRMNETRTRLIVDTAYDAFVAIDTDGRITDWNRQAEVTFGWSRQEAIGRLLADTIIPESYREAHWQGLKRYVTTGTARVLNKRIEMTALNRGGKEFPVELTITPVQLGTTCLFNAFLRDITERKQAEEDLKRTTEELTRSNRELEQFAYIASHDLQEPLRMVASSAQLLARDYQDKLDSLATEYIGFAVEGAKRMQMLINQLLNYSRVGAQRKPFEAVDCEKIYEAAVANLKIVIDESRAALTHDPLPTVMGDDVQLLQVFQNLLANAIKFQRREHPQIHVSAEQKDGQWEFAFRDNGIGIDPKHHKRLFGIFQRLHSREKYSGTGIGLAICKKVVEQHGGRIWVESAPGKGSTFYFTIPLAK